MKTVGKATDLITFSRSSGGTALRKISYGPELVTNGTFDADTTGWSVFAGDFAAVSGQGVLTYTGASATVSQQVDVTAGKVYRVTGQLVSATSASPRLKVGSSAGATDYGQLQAVGEIDLTIVATTSVISLYVQTLASGNTAVDNISVKEVLFDQADGDLVVFNHPADIPRIEYAADGSVKGLLVEEARTNLHTGDVGLTYAVLLTKTANAAVAPDGTETASLHVPDPTSGVHRAGMSLAYSSGASNETYSAYLKAAGYDKVSLLLANQSGGYTASFDLSAGTITNTGSGTLDATIVDVGGGWYRCSMTYTATKTNPYPSVEVLDSENNATFTGDGTSGVYMWGHQIEVADFPTSYIPTSGATATRSADVASIATSAFGYRQSEGTVVVDFKVPALGFANGISINDGNTLNYLRISAPNALEQVRIRFDSAYEAVLDGGTVNPGQYHKYGLAFAENDVAFSLDGGAIASDSSARIPAVNTFDIGAEVSSNGNIHIKSLKYYPRRLTNAQLQELTT